MFLQIKDSCNLKYLKNTKNKMKRKVFTKIQNHNFYFSIFIIVSNLAKFLSFIDFPENVNLNS